MQQVISGHICTLDPVGSRFWGDEVNACRRMQQPPNLAMIGLTTYHSLAEVVAGDKRVKGALP